jgi:hypothetical protein
LNSSIAEESIFSRTDISDTSCLSLGCDMLIAPFGGDPAELTYR